MADDSGNLERNKEVGRRSDVTLTNENGTKNDHRRGIDNLAKETGLQ